MYLSKQHEANVKQTCVLKWNVKNVVELNRIFQQQDRIEMHNNIIKIITDRELRVSRRPPVGCFLPVVT